MVSELAAQRPPPTLRILRAAASMNRPKEVRSARSLIERHATVEPKLLADESVDLRRLTVTARPTRTVAR